MMAYKKMVILVSSLAVIGLTGCPDHKNGPVRAVNYCGSIYRAATNGQPAEPLIDSKGASTYSATFTFLWSNSGVIKKDTKTIDVVAGVACVTNYTLYPTPMADDVSFKSIEVVVAENGATIGSAKETFLSEDYDYNTGTYSRNGSFTLPFGTPAANPSGGSSTDPNTGGTPTTNGAVSKVLNYMSKEKVATQAPVTDSKAKLLREGGSSEDKRAASANAAI